jgi:DNA helicase-2/ATP-dependent DNA helicase PcrA
MEFKPSKHQQAVINKVRFGSGHIMVGARAGSGKSTLLEAIAEIVGASGVVVAFNRHTALHLGGKFKQRRIATKASTIHGIGMGVMYATLGKKPDVQTGKYRKIAQRVIKESLSQQLLAQGQRDKEVSKIIKAREQALFKLTSLARMTLTPLKDKEALRGLINRYGIVLDNVESENAVIDGVPLAVMLGSAQAAAGVIDYDDMLYIPLQDNLYIKQYPFVMVDECQDLNACQLAFVKRMLAPNGRFVFVGDVNQAIMGFAGADVHSYQKIIETTQAEEMPLPTCYRCDKNFIRLAQYFVPDIEWREDAAEGIVRAIHMSNAAVDIQNGALVLSRTTSPLVGLCLRLIRLGKAARVRGKDIAAGLVDMAYTISEMGMPFEEGLEFYVTNQVTALLAKEDTETLIEMLRDRADALSVIWADLEVKSVDALARKINSIFDDERSAIYLSTIHRAKGLEADTVHLLNPKKLPWFHPKQTEADRVQEDNLTYVALTRPKHELVCIHPDEESLPAEGDMWGNFEF